MKKLVIAALVALGMTVSSLPVMADFTFIVPQKPGSGTSVWTAIVAGELEKHLGEKIKIVNIPGANDIPGFNKFHNDLQHDDKTVMVSHGGNGVSYLVDPVDYDYYQYDPIGMMNLTIINGHSPGFNPYTGIIKFSAGSGMNPDMMAHILLKGGPDLTMAQAEEIFASQYKYIKGMSGGDRRLSFQRGGELNVTRESTAAYNKYYNGKEFSKVWFSQGVFDRSTGKSGDNPNHPGMHFDAVFERTWGEAPKGEMYDAYRLAQTFNDALQKSIWIQKESPRKAVLIEFTACGKYNITIIFLTQ
jgi:hypothetical protein